MLPSRIPSTFRFCRPLIGCRGILRDGLGFLGKRIRFLCEFLGPAFGC